MSGEPRKRLLIFIVAYNAEKTIQSVLARIPESLGDTYEVQVLAIDDASRDRTFEEGYRVKVEGALPYPLHVLFNPENHGYGGNQKIGYHYVIENGFDFVALIHGDGQYAPRSAARPAEAAAGGHAGRGVRFAHDDPRRGARGRHAALQVRRQPDAALQPE